ncbi:MAG: RraA family protein [Verrucomicrobiota bacterium]
MPIDFTAVRERLYVAVISDILDELGLTNQVMDRGIRPIPQERVLFGRARTMLSVPVDSPMEKPFDVQIDAVDSLKPEEVVVVNTSSVDTCAFWGELFSTVAYSRKAAGAVIDGFVRDVRKIRDLGLPVYARGMNVRNSKNRQTVLQYDQPITCGGVTVKNGDYIFGETDGCLVIPAKEAEEVLNRALDIADKEDAMRSAILRGSTLREAYDRYQVI